MIHSKILHGMASFVRRRRPGLKSVFRSLAHDQHPVALLLTCSDSRIVSSLLLGTHPGDLFEVRTVGNLIAPAGAGGGSSTGDASEAAAIEYALLALDVRHIMVLGHSGCGAMKAVLKQSVPAGAHNLERWVVHAHPARGRLEGSTFIDPGLPPKTALPGHVLQQLDHIRSYAPVAERLRRGGRRAHGRQPVERADLHAYSAAEGRFIRVDERVIARALAQRAAVSS